MSNLERLRDFPDGPVAKTVCPLCRGQSGGTVTCGKVWGGVEAGELAFCLSLYRSQSSF